VAVAKGGQGALAAGVTCSGNVLVRSDEDSGLGASVRDSLSTWRFRGINSGDIEFVPYLHESQKAELGFQFNTSMTNGNILCTKDDTLALNVELVNSILAVSITDIRTRRVLLTTNCRPKPATSFNDKSLHAFRMVKKGVNQFEVVCDEQEPQALYFRQQHGEDVPFVSTKYGVSFGIGCFEQTRKFTGDLTQVSLTWHSFSSGHILLFEAYNTFNDSEKFHFNFWCMLKKNCVNKLKWNFTLPF
jgi:hypothetical protein